MNHPKHPSCPGCGKAVYKAFEKGKVVKKDDPWEFCRNAECPYAGAEGITAKTKTSTESVSKAKTAEYGPNYAKLVEADRGKIQPVRGSALGRLIERMDFVVRMNGDGAPRAELERWSNPESVPERELFFWKRHYKGDKYPTQLSNHISKFAPNWCPKHKFAFQRHACPACELRVKQRKGAAASTEHPAIQKAREKLEPFVKMLAPSESPPAAIGLIMALLNQMTGSKDAANLLIEEYGLDKLFGLQKF